ncbi:MAG: hypothetical protein ACFFBJ_05235 [Promethearchaeota archaeon]
MIVMKKKTVECKLCGKRFNSKKEMKKHAAEVHQKD